MGIKYRCEECDYQANRKQGVDSHVKIKHMGIKFMCDECEYKAGSQQGLKVHKRSVHKNLFFECEQCEYKASQKGNLLITGPLASQRLEDISHAVGG